MADAWTGLNVEAVKTQLSSFEETMNGIITNYSDAFDLYNEELYVTWGSEKAVAFTKNLETLNGYKRSLCDVLNKILSAAVSAAQFMAKHNGTEFNYDFAYRGYSGKCKALQEDINGVKGMNIPLAKLAHSTFGENCNEIIVELNELPLDFALYDPSGEIQAAYKTLVNTEVNRFSDSVKEANKVISNAFEEETLQIEVGKVEAEEELVTNPTSDETIYDRWKELPDKYSDLWEKWKEDNPAPIIDPYYDPGPLIDPYYDPPFSPDWMTTNPNTPFELTPEQQELVDKIVEQLFWND